jgi:N-acetylglucosaminyldiphosphoundecaprenol N-acetyl-beta-D-mannosaminyltransferase
MKAVKILGVKIDIFDHHQLWQTLDGFLRGNVACQVSTVNPEFILAAQTNQEFFQVLNQADLTVADGIGLKFAGWLWGKNLLRYTGADLMRELLEFARQQGYKVGILNWQAGLSDNEEIEIALQNYYPNLQFVVVAAGRELAALPDRLIEFSPDILFCALGAPWQELVIAQARQILPSLKLGMGIGGALDFLTGKTKRAPSFVRSLGLEWIWRLCKKPKSNSKPVYGRGRRIFNAFVVFSWLAFLDRIGAADNHPNEQ